MNCFDDNQQSYINDSIEAKDAEDAPFVEDSKSCFKTRYTFGFMGFLGLALVYAMRVNLAISIVSMVNDTQTNDNNGNTSDICPDNIGPTNGTIIPSMGEFDWDDSDQGIILCAFAFGFIFTSVPGGRMSEKYGGKLICGLGIFFNAVLSVISPFAAYRGVVPFTVIRVAEGLAAGVTLPAMQSMLAHWVPRLERSKFSAAVYTGMNFGTVIAHLLGGWLCSCDILGGWPLGFYLFGGLGIVWYVFWLILVFDSPAQHPRIDQQERSYIEASIELKQKDDQDSVVPWRAIFTSVPVWAITVSQFGQTWWLCALLAELPSYMHKVLHFDMRQIAYLSMLPYLSSWLVGVGVSVLADALLANKFWTPLVSFKFWNTISSIGPSLGFVGAILAGCNRDIATAMLVCLGSLQGIVYVGNQINHISLAPRYVGTLYGITNAASGIAAILAPYVFGCIIQGHDTLVRWHTTFWLAAGINISTSLFYLIFASAKEQPWSNYSG